MGKQEFYKPKKKISQKDEEGLGAGYGLDLQGSSGRLDSARNTSREAQDSIDNIDEALAAQERDPDSSEPSRNDAEQYEASQLTGQQGTTSSQGQNETEETTEDGSESDRSGDGPWKTNVGEKKKASLWKRASTAKKMWIGGGGVMFLISMVVSIFSFIAPYKADSVIQSIQSRVGGIAENAVEQRLVYYMTRYLILQAAIKHDTSFEKERAFTYVGTGVFKTLYTNWKGANLEAVLEKTDGIRLRPERAIGSMTGRELVRPQNWTIEYLDRNGKPTGQTIKLDSIEARRQINYFAERETKSHQVFQRYKMRKVLKRYYGINNWKPFEKTQNQSRDWYLEKKATFKKWMVNQTVGRLSAKYAAYMSCLIDGGDACKAEQMNPPDESSGGPDEDMEKLIDDDSNNPSGELAKKLQQMALKRMIAASAAGLGILQIIGGIEKSVDSGALSKVTYENNSQQYVGFKSAFRSASDQIKSGEDFDTPDPRVVAETLDGFASSPVYTSGLRTAGVSAAAQYVRDCDGNGSKETTLDPGETVCPNKKVMQDREGIKKMFFWPVISAIGSAYNSTLGKPFEWAASLLNDALSSLGVTALMEKVLEITGLDKVAATLLEAGLQWAIGFSLTGEEVGEAAYDAIYAGMSVTESAMGSTLDGSRVGTIGGALLTAAQISEIKADERAQQQYALSKMSLTERYFSPEVPTSITSYAVMHAPISMTTMSSSFLQAVNPVTLISKFSTLLTAPTFAAAGDSTVNNPFGVVYMGYANSHPALTMEEEDLNATYNCSMPADERPQNLKYGRPDGMPFDIHTETDPCLLNETVGDVGARYFDGSYNETP
jgi:hypothetical protein